MKNSCPVLFATILWKKDSESKRYAYLCRVATRVKRDCSRICAKTLQISISDFQWVGIPGTLHVRDGVLRQPITAHSSYECELVDAYYSDLARVVTTHRLRLTFALCIRV